MFATLAAQVCDDWRDHMSGGWWWVMGIGWLVLLAAVVILAVVLTRHSRGPASTPRRAHDLLDERFARGEIDDEEYRRRRDALQA